MIFISHNIKVDISVNAKQYLNIQWAMKTPSTDIYFANHKLPLDEVCDCDWPEFRE